VAGEGHGTVSPTVKPGLARYAAKKKSLAKYAADLVKKVNADPAMAELTTDNKAETRYLKKVTEKVADRFFANPERMKAILQHLYLRALASDSTLQYYLDRALPRKDGPSAITINLNTSILEKRGKTYNIEGREVTEAELVEAPKVERD
jgi:hypothetical protein